jgi:hypothetical protein
MLSQWQRVCSGQNMAGLNRTNIGKLGLADYPGHIFVCKLRYGYGTQQIIEKLEILHNWYSDLRAYLPMMFKKKNGETEPEYKDKYAPMLEDVSAEITKAYDMYQGTFEGQSCSPNEKMMLKAMRGIKERLDVITAESEVIKGIKTDEEHFQV